MRFHRTILEAAKGSKILGVRAGTTHAFTGVWVVVAQDRVFVRSWSDNPAGWYRAFLAEPDGAMQLPTRARPVRIRARRVRGERMLEAIDAAYAAKYHTPASRKWVRGFSEPERRWRTLELVGR